MFSKTCEYAIKALIFIAQKTNNGEKIGIKEIATGINAPEYFVAKILQNLSKKQFVRSAKGPNGGFYSSEEDLQINLRKVVVEIDGDHIFERCGLGLENCSSLHPCPIHNQFQNIKSNLKKLLESSTIGELAEDVKIRNAFLRY